MKTITADRISEWTGRVVDVRSLNEFAAERLPKAECIPLDTLPGAAQAWKRDEPLLVMCKSGVRSRQAYDQLVACGFANVTMLAGGIDACKKAGADVIVVRRTIPIIRQVLIGAGALLLAGLVLSAWDPRFLLVTWFVTAGLLFAGLTGFCPMARLLEIMPWNKAPEAKAPDACGC
jgi:rhodanese-related sulfurtransferase